MRASWTEYLFSVNTHTPTMTVDSGEEFTIEVRGAFDDIEDISSVRRPSRRHAMDTPSHQ